MSVLLKNKLAEDVAIEDEAALYQRQMGHYRHLTSRRKQCNTDLLNIAKDLEKLYKANSEEELVKIKWNY